MGFVARLGAAWTASRNALLGTSSRAYDGGRVDLREFQSWYPTIDHPDGEYNGARDRIVAKTRDLARNHPVIAGAIDRRTEAVVGPRIRLEAQPNYEAMGRSADWAYEWSTAVEARWEAYANDPGHYVDAERHSTFGGIVETNYRHWMIDGEACAQIPMKRRGGRYQTYVRTIDPDRLSNPNGLADGTTLRNGNRISGGVEYDPDDGNAIAHHIRKRHPSDLLAAENFVWTRVPRERSNGRPVFIHAFRKGRAEQRRGVSKLVSALKLTRMSDRYDSAELESALTESILAFAIESPFPNDDVAAALAPVSDDNASSGFFDTLVNYRSQNKLAVPGVTVRHMLPGEKVNALSKQRPGGNYPAFQATILRKIAAATGISYEQLSQDWSSINYSSARTLLNEIWRSLLHDRELFTQMFCTPIYLAWLEEAILLGEVKMPGGWPAFYRWRAEISQAEWMGPGRGSIDPKKESDADEANLRMNTTTMADIIADSSRNPKKVMEARAREKRDLKRLGLTDITDTPVNAARGAAPVAGDDEGDGDGRIAA